MTRQPSKPRPTDGPTRARTVQCTYASWYARTVVVDAASAEDACERAIEVANESDAWRSLDDCGPTFVDALAEGPDVDPWTRSGSAHPVPERFREHPDAADATALRTALAGLLDWAVKMGGWDAPAWREAARVADRDGGAAPSRE